MSIVTGDVTEVTFNHPTLGSGIFLPKAAEDSTYDHGGFRSGDDSSMITSSGKRVDQKNRVAPFFETTIVATPEDAKKLSDLAENPVQAEWTIQHVAGDVWGFKGTPVGDIQLNRNNGQLTLKVAGDDRMVKIA